MSPVRPGRRRRQWQAVGGEAQGVSECHADRQQGAGSGSDCRLRSRSRRPRSAPRSARLHSALHATSTTHHASGCRGAPAAWSRRRACTGCGRRWCLKQGRSSSSSRMMSTWWRRQGLSHLVLFQGTLPDGQLTFVKGADLVYGLGMDGPAHRWAVAEGPHLPADRKAGRGAMSRSSREGVNTQLERAARAGRRSGPPPPPRTPAVEAGGRVPQLLPQQVHPARHRAVVHGAARQRPPTPVAGARHRRRQLLAAVGVVPVIALLQHVVQIHPLDCRRAEQADSHPCEIQEYPSGS